MIEQLDTQQFPRLSQAPRDVPVIWGGLEIAARVVVGHDDGGGPSSDRLTKHFYRTVDNGTI